jgi:magnesium transporter
VSETDDKTTPPPPETAEEEVYGAPPDLVAAVVEALEKGDRAKVAELTRPLHYADLADLLETVDPEQRSAVLRVVGKELDPDTLPELDEAVREEVIEQIGLDKLAEAVTELDSDDAVYIIEELDEEDKREVLESLPAPERTLIEEGLSYPENSAGRLMQRELVAVPASWTVGETIEFMRQDAEAEEEGRESPLPEVFYDIFVVDEAHRPLGSVPLSRLLRARKPVTVSEIMATDIKIIPATLDQEDVAFLFRQRDLTSAPVVDEAGRLVGAVTIDDVVDVIDEEQEEDIMRLGGVSEDDFHAGVIDTARARSTWLAFNMGTALLSTFVISRFSSTIEQVVTLAALMPVVASMGGNAGTQAMTVAVRALATKELSTLNALRSVGKEVLVGGFNGLLFASLTGAVAWWWFDSPLLGGVLGLAIVVNLLVAGLAGASIPLAMHRAGTDPAVSSGVFLTMITDAVGFFVFLGLAAWILL